MARSGGNNAAEPQYTFATAPSERRGGCGKSYNRGPEPPVLLKTARKIVVAVVGGTVLLLGVVMIVTPGPAFIFIPAGLGILATEFVFAAKLLKKVKQRALEMAGKVGVTGVPPAPPPAPPQDPGA